MPSYYPYLISSLPMLHFGMRNPFSREKFLKICRHLIPEDDLRTLELSLETEDYLYQGNCATLKKWRGFNTLLRNELVKIRAARKHSDPKKYLRPDHCALSAITHIALAAHRNPSILEAERMLDQERWHFLDELEAGHYFDLDFLLIYSQKLMILERWQRINTADKTALLEKVLLG